MNKIALYIVLAFLTIGCTETPVTLPEKITPADGKVILLEDLTGVECANCPSATMIIDEIAEDFPGNIIVVAVHGGTLQTKPYPESKHDFRSEDSDFITEYLRPWFGKPAISYNRRLFPGQNQLSIIGEPEIPVRVEELLSEPQLINIESSFNFDEETRQLEVFAGISALQDLEGDFYVTLLVTESHIIDPQSATGQGLVLDYEHNHILRDIISAQAGDQFSTSLPKNELINKTWSYTIPELNDGLWVLENLEFVIFVSDHTGTSKEVIQAHKFKL